MKKSDERKKIETLKTGDSIRFPRSKHVKLTNLLNNVNRQARVDRLMTKEEVMFSIDSKISKTHIVIKKVR